MDERAKALRASVDAELHHVATSMAQAIDEPQESEQEIYKQLHSFQKLVEEGAYTLFEALLQTPTVISSKIAQELANLVILCRDLGEVQEEYTKLIFSGSSLQEIAHVSDETLELLYQVAKGIYEEERYKEGRDVFAFLTLLNPSKYAFWLALGDCEFQMHRYDQALTAYSFAIHYNPTDPLCHLYSSRCYEKMHDHVNAINSFDLALYVIGTRREYDGWKAAIHQEKLRLLNRR